MKITVTLEGDDIEDAECFNIYAKARDMHSAIWDTRQEIRSRLKYGENVSSDEEGVLEKLQELLYVEGLEW